jgi:hypothetical protein
MTILTPTTEPEFATYLAKAIPEFAQDKVDAGQWAVDDALELSRTGYAEQLPLGLSTPGNFFFTVRDATTHADVGMLWFAVQARARGLAGVALHVFGHNSSAQALYHKLGYQTTNISMFKTLVDRGGGDSGELRQAPTIN